MVNGHGRDKSLGLVVDGRPVRAQRIELRGPARLLLAADRSSAWVEVDGEVELHDDRSDD